MKLEFYGIVNMGELRDSNHEFHDENDFCINEDHFISSYKWDNETDTIHEPPENVVFLPSVCGHLLGSVFKVKGTNWYNKTESETCLIDIRNSYGSVEILIGDLYDSIWVEFSIFDKFLKAVEAKYICNVFDDLDQHEAKREMVKNAYLMRVLKYYKYYKEDLEHENLEREIEDFLDFQK